MLVLAAERGGDPERAGKRDPLDPLLWRGARDGEPAWPGGQLGPGRPGWHIECAVIALGLLGDTIDVQGGGNDLLFPHHECSAAHAERLTGQAPFASHYVHAGMIGLDGEKMSKSRGNLVFVSRLRADHVDPMALRLALIADHYRGDRTWTDDLLKTAEDRLARWRAAAAADRGSVRRRPAGGRTRPRRRRPRHPGRAGPGRRLGRRDPGRCRRRPGRAELMAHTVDALLGITLDTPRSRPLTRAPSYAESVGRGACLHRGPGHRGPVVARLREARVLQ